MGTDVWYNKRIGSFLTASPFRGNSLRGGINLGGKRC